MIFLGDSIGRRFYPFVSLPHRIASAFICGLLFCTWWSYALGYMFASTASPMLWGNVAFFVTAVSAILWLDRNPAKRKPETSLDLADAEFQRWDWVAAGAFLLFASWLMFKTFSMVDGNMAVGTHQYPDFGSVLSITQSFAEGHNFPTQYPTFTGERMLFQFLFYFQAGNLEYLGLNPAVSINLLSIFSLTSLLILTMTLGTVVFRSRLAGRIGAALFFFNGSLAFIPFVIAQGSFPALLTSLGSMNSFLKAGFPYRGDDWGVWTQNVFLTQRYLPCAIAIFMLVLVYLAILIRERIEAAPVVSAKHGKGSAAKVKAKAAADAKTAAEAKATAATEAKESESPDTTPKAAPSGPFGIAAQYYGCVFSGIVLGLLPMWSAAVFLAACLVVLTLLLLFRLRRELLAVAVPTLIFALPQIIYLKTGNVRPVNFAMLKWGFVIDDAGIVDVIYWTFYTFGFKWFLLAIGLYFASRMQRRFLAAVSILLPLTYCFRFGDEIMANHRFLNIWLVVANVFVGYGLVKLWDLKAGSSVVPMRVLAVVLTLLVTLGGMFDLMPIKNSEYITVKYTNDKVIDWVKANTDPKAIFLSHRHLHHPILLAGRKLFYGDPYYGWGTDYNQEPRDPVLRTMFESTDAADVYRLLKENNISYVAFDDQIRKARQIIKNPNEDLYAKYFQLVFTEDKSEYGNLKIYKVPDSLNLNEVNEPIAEVPAENAFKTGSGASPGKFANPRGIALDSKGFIYIADTFNARIQKFKSDGTFVSAFGTPGPGEGELKEPNGVAVDEAGNVYVTDSLNHRLLKYGPDGKFVKEWKGPEGDFYGPRDLSFGPNKLLYIIDQGHTRIANFDPATEEFSVWGASGAGEGQFNEASGIAVGGNMIIITDRDNHRIQVFDLSGKFIRQWPLEGLDRGHYPDAVYDDVTKQIYVSDGKSNQILVFNVDGSPQAPLKIPDDARLDNPSSMAILDSGKQRQLLVVNTGSSNLVAIELAGKKGK